MKYKVYGYSSGASPLNTGICVCECEDDHYAKMIVEALAFKYMGQWWGYSWVERTTGVTLFSSPIKIGIQEDK